MSKNNLETQLGFEFKAKPSCLEITLNGNLNHYNLNLFFSEFKQKSVAVNYPKVILDLTNLSGVDSAGFAVISDIIYHYKDTEIELKNPPSELKSLANLFGLDDFYAKFNI